jgi:hypothetical protein
VSNGERLPHRSVRRQKIRQLVPLAITVLAMMMAFTAELAAMGVPVDKAIWCAGGVATITVWLVRRIVALETPEPAGDAQPPVAPADRERDDGQA